MEIKTFESKGYLRTDFIGVPDKHREKGLDTVRVTTTKGTGKIYSVFQWGITKEGDGYTTFNYTRYQDPAGLISLRDGTKRVTKQMIQRAHQEALYLFQTERGWEVQP